VLLDDPIRPLQERRRNRQAESLGGLSVDDQLELRRLLHGLAEARLVVIASSSFTHSFVETASAKGLLKSTGPRR